MTFDYLQFTDTYISGDEMLKKAKELDATSGKEECEYLLEHQDLIPKKYRGDKYLVFPEYTKLSSVGYRGVACLYWDGSTWVLYWHWLVLDFDSHGLVVRARKSLDSKSLSTAGLSALGHIKNIEISLEELKKLL